jgi:hypothetical protein
MKVGGKTHLFRATRESPSLNRNTQHRVTTTEGIDSSRIFRLGEFTALQTISQVPNLVEIQCHKGFTHGFRRSRFGWAKAMPRKFG